jgi:hypothetical protein
MRIVIPSRKRVNACRHVLRLFPGALVVIHEDEADACASLCVAPLGAELLVQLPALRSQFFEFRDLGKDGPCRLILANAILLMCRAPKVRTAMRWRSASSHLLRRGRESRVSNQ